MIDVLLIEPSYYNEIDNPIVRFTMDNVALFPPLGLAYVAGVLRDASITTAGLDLSLKNNTDIDSIIKEINRINPTIIGISLNYAFKSIFVFNLIKAIKKTLPGIKIIVGGNHATFTSEEVLRNGADVVVRYEGEFSFFEVCRHYIGGQGTLANIAGIAYLDEADRVNLTPDRAMIGDLDVVPFPDYSIFGSFDAYMTIPKRLYMMASRGCPNKCIFCATSAYHKQIIRTRSIKNIMEEIKWRLKSYPFTEIYFVDDALTVNHNRIKELCAEMKKLNIKWHCNSHVNSLNEELIQVMSESNCTIIKIGVESANAQILKSIKKNITIERVYETAKLCAKYNIKLICGMMFPFPDDTWQTIAELKTAMQTLINLGAFCDLNITTPLPGTDLYDHADGYNIKINTRDWNKYAWAYPVISTQNFTSDEIAKIFASLESYLYSIQIKKMTGMDIDPNFFTQNKDIIANVLKTTTAQQLKAAQGGVLPGVPA